MRGEHIGAAMATARRLNEHAFPHDPPPTPHPSVNAIFAWGTGNVEDLQLAEVLQRRSRREDVQQPDDLRGETRGADQ